MYLSLLHLHTWISKQKLLFYLQQKYPEINTSRNTIMKSLIKQKRGLFSLNSYHKQNTHPQILYSHQFNPWVKFFSQLQNTNAGLNFKGGLSLCIWKAKNASKYGMKLKCGLNWREYGKVSKYFIEPRKFLVRGLKSSNSYHIIYLLWLEGPK